MNNEFSLSFLRSPSTYQCLEGIHDSGKRREGIAVEGWPGRTPHYVFQCDSWHVPRAWSYVRNSGQASGETSIFVVVLLSVVIVSTKKLIPSYLNPLPWNWQHIFPPVPLKFPLTLSSRLITQGAESCHHSLIITCPHLEASSSFLLMKVSSPRPSNF